MHPLSCPDPQAKMKHRKESSHHLYLVVGSWDQLFQEARSHWIHWLLQLFNLLVSTPTEYYCGLCFSKVSQQKQQQYGRVWFHWCWIQGSIDSSCNATTVEALVIFYFEYLGGSIQNKQKIHKVKYFIASYLARKHCGNRWWAHQGPRVHQWQLIKGQSMTEKPHHKSFRHTFTEIRSADRLDTVKWNAVVNRLLCAFFRNRESSRSTAHRTDQPRPAWSWRTLFESEERGFDFKIKVFQCVIYCKTLLEKVC